MISTIKVDLYVYEDGRVTTNDMRGYGWVLVGRDSCIIKRPKPTDEELKQARIEALEAQIAYEQQRSPGVEKMQQELEKLRNE